MNKKTSVLSNCSSFEDNEDIIQNCEYLQRLASIILMHDKIRQDENTDIDKKDEFVNKCTIQYHNGSLLDDIYHLQRKHCERYQQIQMELKKMGATCNNLSKCLSIQRHFGSERRREKPQTNKNDIDKYELYNDILDNVHLIIFHSPD